MSIINEALKKVQQSFPPRTDYINSNLPPVEKLTEANENTTSQKPPIKTKIRSIYINTCIVMVTLAITIASIDYICQQFQTDIPRVQRLAKKSLLSLLPKKFQDEVKIKPPEPKPLAQLIIKPSMVLNINGIMSNGNSNLVLINNQVYQEGDSIDGAKIVKINLDSITIINNGATQTILVKN